MKATVRLMTVAAFYMTGCQNEVTKPRTQTKEAVPVVSLPVAQPETEDALFQRAKKLYEEQKLEEACSLFTDVIRLNPKHAEALKSRAGCYLGMDNKRKQTPEEKRTMAMKAREDCNAALQVNATYSLAFHNRGYANWELGDQQGAIEDLTTAIANGDLTLSYRVRGEYYRDMGEDRKSLDDFDVVVKREPNNVYARYLRGCASQMIAYDGAAIDDFQEIMRLQPHYNVDVWNRIMNLHDKYKRWDDCIQHQTDLLKLIRNPKGRSICFSNRGLYYERKNDFYSAISDYSDSIANDADNPNPRNQISIATDRVRSLKGNVTAKLIALEMDERIKHVPVRKSPPYHLPESTSKVVEDTLRISHTVTVANTWKDESVKQGAVKAWFVEASSTIRNAVERSTSHASGEESERKRSVTMKGPTPGKGICVVWVDCYRTGKARMVIDGMEVTLPFEYKDDFDLLAEACEDKREGQS